MTEFQDLMPHPAESQKSMGLEGNLHSIKLADILKFLSTGRMTGHLTLSNPDSRNVSLAFREGYLTGTMSPDRLMKLGQILMHSGDLTRNDLKNILLVQKEHADSQKLGALLLNHELATREQITTALHLQVKEELCELFSWNDGAFKFEQGITNSVGIDISINIDDLVDQRILDHEKWESMAGDPKPHPQDSTHGHDIQRYPGWIALRGIRLSGLAVVFQPRKITGRPPGQFPPEPRNYTNLPCGPNIT